MEITYRNGDGDVVVGIKKFGIHSLFGSITGSVEEFEDAVLELSNKIRERRCERTDIEFVPPPEDTTKDKLLNIIQELVRQLAQNGN